MLEETSSPGHSLSSGAGPESSESQGADPGNEVSSADTLQSQEPVSKDSQSSASEVQLGRQGAVGGQVSTVGQPSSASGSEQTSTTTTTGQTSRRIHPSSIPPSALNGGQTQPEGQPAVGQSTLTKQGSDADDGPPVQVEDPRRVDQPSDRGQVNQLPNEHSLVKGQTLPGGYIPMGYQSLASGQQPNMGQFHHGGRVPQPFATQHGTGFVQMGQPESLAQDFGALQLGTLPPDQSQVCSVVYTAICNVLENFMHLPQLKISVVNFVIQLCCFKNIANCCGTLVYLYM